MTPAFLPTLSGVLVLAGLAGLQPAVAADCPVTHEQLTDALRQSVKPSGGPANGGLENHEWAAAVDRDGVVCAVTFSGDTAADQWLGSRAIAAEKAGTVNALSLDDFALSTANLYAGAQPGGFLFGLGSTDPVDVARIHDGDPATFGTPADPMVGHVVGGVVVFGGGLALYGPNGRVGGLGVSGDSSCADHNVAWRVRQALHLDAVPNGVSPEKNDAIIYDLLPDNSSESGYGHAACKGTEATIAQEIGAGMVPPWASQAP